MHRGFPCNGNSMVPLSDRQEKICQRAYRLIRILRHKENLSRDHGEDRET